MNPPNDSRAWSLLADRAAAQLRPGFAQRVLRAARGAGEAADRALLRHFALSAAAVMACLVLGVIVHTRSAEAETARNVSAWQQLADDADDGDADDLTT